MMRILLAEDNAVNQTVARELLKKLGHEVEIVDNGAKAVEAAGAGSYDIVLMDLHMPVMDGLEASRRIVGLSGSRPRIIAVTANVTAGTREECLEAGMDDYLSKPITLERLRAMLEKWTPADGAAAPSPSPARESSGASNSALGTHLQNLAVDTDPEFVRELIGIFVESGAGLLDEMVRAREVSDWQTLERAAHSLKGASNNIGATGLAGLCLALEKAAAEGTGTEEQIGEIQRAFQSTEIELRAFAQPGG